MRAVFIAATALALLLVTAGCTPAEQAGEPGTTPDATDTATSPSPAPATTATAQPQQTEADEDVVVAVDADGRVIVLDPATGDERDQLLEDVPVDDPAGNDIAMGADSRHVFVVVPADEPSEDAELVRIPVEGGEPETIAAGTAPALSPDGETLAYVTYEEDPDAPVPMPEPVIVLHDLDSGDETRLEREDAFHFIPEVEWAGDGAQLVFTAGEIHTGLYAVDRDADSLDRARRLGPDLDDETDPVSWGPVAPFGDDRLAVVDACCDVPREERHRVAAVDLADGTVTEERLVPRDRLEATHLDADADAGRLLIVVGGGPGGGELLRWDGEGEPDEIADRIIVAAW